MARNVEEEALDWWRRTKRTPVSEGDLAAFREWMEIPAHAEAYRRIDAQRSAPGYGLRRSYSQRRRKAFGVWLVFIALSLVASVLHAPIAVFVVLGVAFLVTFLITQLRVSGTAPDPFDD